MVHYHYSLALAEIGKKSLAKAEFETALWKRPTPDVRKNIASALHNMKP
jgi:hypothetical protein